MKLKLVYFARLREAFGHAKEEVTVPASVANVEMLVAWLRTRGGVWEAELAPGRAFRVAIDQEMAIAITPLVDGAEVAIFPPVTGG